MAKSSSQKFIARNRAPRVQIEYDVELYGAEKKIQLPFIMGVLANISGKPAEQLPDVAERKFVAAYGRAGRTVAALSFNRPSRIHAYSALIARFPNSGAVPEAFFRKPLYPGNQSLETASALTS